jgi:hypothetical protein
MIIIVIIIIMNCRDPGEAAIQQFIKAKHHLKRSTSLSKKRTIDSVLTEVYRYIYILLK